VRAAEIEPPMEQEVGKYLWPVCFPRPRCWGYDIPRALLFICYMHLSCVMPWCKISFSAKVIELYRLLLASSAQLISKKKSSAKLMNGCYPQWSNELYLCNLALLCSGNKSSQERDDSKLICIMSHL
jgi:hypothetical protein